MFGRCFTRSLFLHFGCLLAAVVGGREVAGQNTNGGTLWPPLSQMDSSRSFPSSSLAPIGHWMGPNGGLQDGRAAASAYQWVQQNRDLEQRSVPFIATFARQNADLAQQLVQLIESQRQLGGRLAAANQKLADIRGDYQSVSRKLARYGLTPTIGLLLRHRKEQLDSWQTQDNETHFARAELRRTQHDALELELIPSGEGSIEQQAIRLLDQSVAPGIDSRDVALRQQMESLLYQRSQLVSRLKQRYRQYQHHLDELDSAASATIAATADFRKLINQHVTWIRSGNPIGIGDLSNAKHGIAALFEFRHTQWFGRDLGRKLEDDHLAGAFLLAFFTVMLFIRWRLKSWLIAIGSKKKMRTSGNTRIVAAGALTLGLASIVPMLGYVTAWWLERGIVSETLLQVASSLSAASLIALLVELPRQLLRPLGLVDKHLSKKMSTRAEAFRGLSAVGIVLVPGEFAITMFEQIDHGIWRDSLGRFAFLVLMMVVSCFGHFALRPRKGFLCPAVKAFGGRLATGFGHLWYALAVGFPVLMGILSALGYGYTATELIQRATLSLILLMVAAVVWKVGGIGFSQVWRRLTRPKVEPRYDEYGLIEEPEPEGDVDETQVVLKHQIGFLGQCLASVACVACFVSLWTDVIPNMNVANPVLWTIQENVSVASSGDLNEGQTLAQSASAGTTVKQTPITLLNLVSAAAILFVAIQLSRLLPTLFDVLVLQRVDYDEGMEHLILVLGRVVLFATGCFLACRLVGIRWMSIQWLVVGMTIGLGFGLQDIVRNLLGGLVVLFARPVNVGDRVTVGRVTGRISSQTLRTTILSDDEGRQLQIPNRKFLSDDVTSWRGAGKLTTVAIEVSVHREERPIDMGRMLQEWASGERHVLQSPGPQVTLVCVGKQTQRYELYVWTEDQHGAKALQKALLDIVRKNLRERNLLAKSQPEQPAIRSSSVDANSDLSRASRRSA